MMVAIAFRKSVPIAKIDPPARLVFGWASVVEENGIAVVDSQGDTMSVEELEKTAYDFAENCRKAGEMHTNLGVGELVESMVMTKAKQDALGIDLGKIGWWVGFRLSPEVFAKVADGTYRAFSIGGTGQRVPLAKAAPKAQTFGQSLASHLGIQAPAKPPVITRPDMAPAPTRDEHPLTKAVRAAEANAAPRGGRSIVEEMADTLADAQDQTLPVAARISAMNRLAVQLPLAEQAVNAMVDSAKAHQGTKLMEKARAVLAAAKAGEHPLIRACRGA